MSRSSKDVPSHPNDELIPSSTVERLLEVLLDVESVDPEDVHTLLIEAGIAETARDAITSSLHRLRRDLRAARQRRDELATLFASSRELAEQRDLETLLERLVGRAHSLLQADLTWLSEIDPDTSELVVRTATGTVSSELEGVRVAPGSGLAWHVAAHRRAHSTRHYHFDPGFSHDGGADRALQAEGVVSALAVPLITGEEVIGTLFVANRLENTFQPDQVALLTAFADHAAVLLQGARLLDRAQTNADEAQRSRAELAAHVTAMERAQAERAELTECVLRGESAHAVVDTLARILGRDVTVLDEDGSAMTAATRNGAGPLPRKSVLTSAISESRQSGRFVSTSCAELSGLVAVVAGDTYFGSLAIGGAGPLDPIARNTVEDAASAMALLRLREDADAEADARVRGELLSDLIDAHPTDFASARLRSRARGIDLDDLGPVIVAATNSASADIVRTARGFAPPPAMITQHERVVVMVFRGHDQVDLQELWRRLRSRAQTAVLAVQSSNVTSANDLPNRYREARDCARILPALGIEDHATTTTPYRLYARLFDPDPTGIGEFIEATLGPLLLSDRDRGTDLIHTIDTFARCNTNTVQTSRTLHVHANTVVQRLDRVSALLGSSWREPDSFFQVQVAARLETLRRRAGSVPSGGTV